MYSLRQAKKALERPHVMLREVNKLYHTRLGRLSFDPDGVDLFEEDWDNLLLLDACRYDMFLTHHDLPGRLERRRTRGSHTTEFLRGNVAGRTLDDTVYVTASPMYHRERKHGRIGGRFHAVVNVWEEEGWDPERHTVLPETMREYALRAAREYPDKRLVVHFLQPHYPFIGPTWESEDRDLAEGRDLAFDWTDVATGALDISRETLWQASAENLDLTMPHLKALLEELDGRTVVTADHGQLFGERQFPIPIAEYGHPPGQRSAALVEVPWLVHDNGPRRRTRFIRLLDGEEGATEEPDHSDENDVEDRLEQLGYR